MVPDLQMRMEAGDKCRCAPILLFLSMDPAFCKMLSKPFYGTLPVNLPAQGGPNRDHSPDETESPCMWTSVSLETG
jgi:hypothetical protein